MRIAHLSDLHLARGPLAVPPAAALADALARALALEPRPDCLVITGDLADTGHPDEYAALRDILRKCPVPVHLLPGNHDDPGALPAGQSRGVRGGTQRRDRIVDADEDRRRPVSA